MNLIFLDIDGVLNRLGTVAEGRTTTKHEGFIGMEPELVERFNQLCLDVGCDVVLSSTWRLSEQWLDHMKECGLTCNFIDRTPKLPGVIRGIEIQQWLENHANAYTKYAIIDDDSDMLMHQPFFKTSYKDGLTQEIASKIIQYFKQ